MPIPAIQSRQKSIRSFSIRTGRITPAQQSAFDNSWQCFGLDLDAGVLDIQQAFNHHRPTVLEIGFGNGNSLFSMCRQNPQTNFIGIEVYPAGVGQLLHRAQQAPLDNLKIYMADAADVLTECIAEHSLERIQIYFPDPWHKKRHHKRRLLQADFLRQLASKITADGQIHIATDWQPYAEHILELLPKVNGLIDSGHPHNVKPEWRPETKYETRGSKLGHRVFDIVLAKKPLNGSPLLDPIPTIVANSG